LLQSNYKYREQSLKGVVPARNSGSNAPGYLMRTDDFVYGYFQDPSSGSVGTKQYQIFGKVYAEQYLIKGLYVREERQDWFIGRMDPSGANGAISFKFRNGSSSTKVTITSQTWDENFIMPRSIFNNDPRAAANAVSSHRLFGKFQINFWATQGRYTPYIEADGCFRHAATASWDAASCDNTNTYIHSARNIISDYETQTDSWHITSKRNPDKTFDILWNVGEDSDFAHSDKLTTPVYTTPSEIIANRNSLQNSIKHIQKTKIQTVSFTGDDICPTFTQDYAKSSIEVQHLETYQATDNKASPINTDFIGGSGDPILFTNPNKNWFETNKLYLVQATMNLNSVGGSVLAAKFINDESIDGVNLVDMQV
jgi:hypothetical protein